MQIFLCSHKNLRKVKPCYEKPRQPRDTCSLNIFGLCGIHLPQHTTQTTSLPWLVSSFSSITKQVSVKIWIKISKQSVFLSFSKASTSLNNATNFQHYYHFLSKILPDTEQLIKGIVGITIGHKRHSNLSHRKISVTVNFKSWKTFMENFGSQKTSGSQKNLSCRKI